MRAIYHPGLDRIVVVDDLTADHFAASGWISVEAHQANLAEAEKRRLDAAKVAAAPAAARGKAASSADKEG